MKSTKEVLYESVYFLMVRVCSDFSKGTGLPFNECVSEANVAFCEAYLSYDTTKNVKFSTFFHRCVTNRLRTLKDKHDRDSKKYLLCEGDGDEDPLGRLCEKNKENVSFKLKLTSLSKSRRFIIESWLNGNVLEKIAKDSNITIDKTRAELSSIFDELRLREDFMRGFFSSV